MYYYGYKLHVVCGISGVVHSFNMTVASVHDIRYLKDVQWEYHNCMTRGDRGYLSTEVQQNLFDVANITFGSAVSVESEELETACMGIQKVPKAD